MKLTSALRLHDASSNADAFSLEGFQERATSPFSGARVVAYGSKFERFGKVAGTAEREPRWKTDVAFSGDVHGVASGRS